MQTNKPGSLKDRFENFGDAPSDGLWNAIESSLSKEKKKRRGIFWWWLSGIAAGLLIIFGIYQLGYQHGKSDIDTKLTDQKMKHDDHRVGTENHQHDTVPTCDLSSNQETNLAEDNTENTKPQNGLHVGQENSSFTAIDNLVERESGIPMNNLSVEPRQANMEQVKFSMIRLGGEVICPLPNQTIFPHLTEPQIDLSKENENLPSWEFGISGEYLGCTYPSADMMLPPTSQTFDNSGTNALINGTESYNTPVVESNNTIYRPFNLGLSFARKFNQRLSLSGGLVFHRLIEKNTYYSGDVSFAHLKFTTLGIPLAIEFDYVNSKRFEFSVGTGVMNEFPVLVTTRTTYVNSALSQGKSTQFSSGYFGAALVHLKFDYKFSDRWRIGFSPSMRYYFIQRLNSPHPVLERKFWVGMQAGLTFSF